MSSYPSSSVPLSTVHTVNTNPHPHDSSEGRDNILKQLENAGKTKEEFEKAAEALVSLKEKKGDEKQANKKEEGGRRKYSRKRGKSRRRKSRRRRRN
jgi:hypothetical protein